MPAGILTAIITACAVFVAALSALVYWYAFSFEPVNFKVSNIKINLKKNTGTSEGIQLATGKSSGILDNAAGISGEHLEINDKTAYSSEKITPLPDMVVGNISKAANLSANSTGSTDNPSAAPDFTILHLSDFHLRKDRKGEKLFEFVRSLSSCNPDFIFITGDLVEKDIYFDYLIKMLEVLNAKAGKYTVFGVHDYYNKSPNEFMKNMVKRQKEYRLKNDVSGLISKLGGIGIKVLRNERVSHELSPDFIINITGLEDSIIDKTDTNKAFGENNKEDGKKEISYKAGSLQNQAIDKTDIAKAFGTYSKEDGKKEISRNEYNVKEVNKNLFVQDGKNVHNLHDNHKLEICLTHTPDMDLFGRLVENGADIVLAGHTHGGQVRLPGIGAIISGCNINAKYASGLFYFKKFVLYVSRGLGEGRYSPFRFYCPPEATVIKVCFNENR
jgi:predicted MPP superfamily phosphohydrolase